MVAASLVAVISIGARLFFVERSVPPVDAIAYATDQPSFTTALPMLEPTAASPIQSSVALSFSLQDYAVAVFQPLTASAESVAAKVLPQTTQVESKSAAIPSDVRTAGSISHKCPYASKGLSWPERLMKDVMVKPVGNLNIIDDQRVLKSLTESTPSTTGSFDGNADIAKQTSLSLRVHDTLSVIPGGKAIMEVVNNELRDVNDALNQLLIAVGRQVDRVRAEAKEKKRRALKMLWLRNKRASRNAKKLHRAGRRILARLLQAKAKA